MFWSSVVLTGNETDGRFIEAFATEMFYRANEEERRCIWLTKKEVTPEAWVLVIDDSASESKSAEKLTEGEREEFYAECRKVLRDEGLMH